MKIIKTILITLLLIQTISLKAQSEFKIKLNNAYKTTTIESSTSIDMCAIKTVVSKDKKGYYLLLDVEITPQKNAPRRVADTSVFVIVDGVKYKSIGNLDSRGRFKKSRYGMAIYSYVIKQTLIFDIPVSSSPSQFGFYQSSTKIGSLVNYMREEVETEMKITKIKLVNKLTKSDSSIVLPSQGNFMKVTLTVQFSKERDISSNEFSLVSKDGIYISSIGRMKNDLFLDIISVGVQNYDKNYKGEITIVFQIGNLSLDDIKSKYNLAFKGDLSNQLKFN